MCPNIVWKFPAMHLQAARLCDYQAIFAKNDIDKAVRN
jgi:hypothetical protein